MLARSIGAQERLHLLFLLALAAGCGGDQPGISDTIPIATTNPFAFDAATASDRLLSNYELIDISDSERCERLPLGPGLLAPTAPSTLLCLRHSQCPERDLCSARITCEVQPDGRCLAVVAGTRCAGDQCQRDSDCQTGSRCFCEAGRKACLIASCASDSDCAAGQRCRPTWLQRQAAEELLTCNGDQKYYACTTPEDECSDDEGCPPQGARCGYDRARGRFACLPCAWRVP